MTLFNRTALGLIGAFLLTPASHAGTVYIPQRGEWMWDTWVMQEGEEYHLFHLSKDGGIGRAVSKDLINWKQLPMIRNLAKPGDWDEKGMLLTGSTVKHDGRYYLSYGSKHPEPLGYLVSDDLKTWSRLGDPVLPSRLPYAQDWRDLSNYWDSQANLWHGCLCARYKGMPCVGHVSSPDLVRWTHHEPFFTSEPYTRDNNGFVEFEVPEMFELGGKHYIVFSSIRSRKNFTSGREDASGTWYLVADRKEGPYSVPNNPLLMGTGMGRIDHYVGRTILRNGKRVMYCQNWGPYSGVNWSTPKLVHASDSHDLSLKYWPELDVLKKEKLYSAASLRIKTDADKQNQIHDIDKLTASDFMLTCDLDAAKAASCTITWRSALPLSPPNSEKTPTYGLKVEPKDGCFSLVQVVPSLHFGGNTYQSYINDRYKNKFLCSSGKLQIRIMVRHNRSEVYANDIWLFNIGPRDMLPKGGFSIISEKGEVNISNLEIFALEELKS